jgi:hypothetical protein
MEYQLVLSPDIDLSPADVLKAWEADGEASKMATAYMANQAVRSFDPLLMAGIVAFATTVGTGVLTNMLADVLLDALKRKFGEHDKKSRKRLRIIEIQEPDGRRLLVVEQEEEV